MSEILRVIQLYAILNHPLSTLKKERSGCHLTPAGKTSAPVLMRSSLLWHVSCGVRARRFPEVTWSDFHEDKQPRTHSRASAKYAEESGRVRDGVKRTERLNARDEDKWDGIKLSWVCLRVYMAEWQLLKCLSTGDLLRRSVCFQLYADSSAVHTQMLRAASWGSNVHNSIWSTIDSVAPPLERRLANGSRVSVAPGAELGSLGVGAIEKHWKMRSSQSHRFHGVASKMKTICAWDWDTCNTDSRYPQRMGNIIDFITFPESKQNRAKCP